MVFVLSVGGGDLEKNISPNLVRALEYAKEIGATICGIVGRNGGFTAKVADACVIVPTVNAARSRRTPRRFRASSGICSFRTRRSRPPRPNGNPASRVKAAVSQERSTMTAHGAGRPSSSTATAS